MAPQASAGVGGPQTGPWARAGKRRGCGRCVGEGAECCQRQRERSTLVRRAVARRHGGQSSGTAGAGGTQPATLLQPGQGPSRRGTHTHTAGPTAPAQRRDGPARRRACPRESQHDRICVPPSPLNPALAAPIPRLSLRVADAPTTPPVADHPNAAAQPATMASVVRPAGPPARSLGARRAPPVPWARPTQCLWARARGGRGPGALRAPGQPPCHVPPKA